MTAPAADSHPPFSNGEDFASRYCRWRRVARSAFVETLLAETLYPHARLLRHCLPANCFNLDRSFVENVGRLRQRRDFRNAMLDFLDAYEGHHWSRAVLHLRISVDRMRDIVQEVFAADADATASQLSSVA